MTTTPSGTAILNSTMRKFGAPETIIHQFQYWIVMLRPIQLTLGSLVLAAHEPARSFSQLGQESFTELHKVTGQLESALAKAFNYDKLNYLMLMMVDPNVHFHVLPRYSGSRTLGDATVEDTGWPGPPDLKSAPELTSATLGAIRLRFLENWLTND